MTAETGQLLVGTHGKDGEETVMSITEVEEEASGGVVADHDHQAHAFEIPETRMVVTVTFLKAGEEEAGPTTAVESHQRGLAQHQHHLGQALGVAVRHAALINRIDDPRPPLQAEEETEGSGRVLQGETRTGVAPTDAEIGVA